MSFWVGILNLVPSTSQYRLIIEEDDGDRITFTVYDRKDRALLTFHRAQRHVLANRMIGWTLRYL